MTNSKRDGFSNRFGVLVAVAGSAVGLGNLYSSLHHYGHLSVPSNYDF
jgi:hypothetical protein